MSPRTIDDMDDDEAKARWLSVSQDEVVPQVEADPAGVAAVVVPVHAHHEADFETIKTVYREAISAHFPTSASAQRAVERIEAHGLPEDSHVRVFRADDPHIETTLEADETIVLIQLGRSESDHAPLETIITEEGGTRVHYSPPQSLSSIGFSEE